MTTAIGVVITEHIVAGRLQDQRLSGSTILFPDQSENTEELAAMPGEAILSGAEVRRLAEELATRATGRAPCQA